MTPRLAALLAAFVPAALLAADPPKAKGPLADLPSRPGPHVEKIQALGDNEWLSLGAPAADPKWGSARGRSWSSNQPAAPDLRGGFVFGEGVHGYTKPDGRYMNDLWFYDLNAHRWVCLYPGIEVKTVAKQIRDKELTLDDRGLLVGKDGQPLPPLLIHAYGNLGYDPDARRFACFGSQFGNYFTTGKGGVFEEANHLYQELRKDKKFPSLSPFFYDVATGTIDAHPVEVSPKGAGGYGPGVLVYVTSLKRFFFGGADGVWSLDPDKKTWVDAKPKGTPPSGIDLAAAYDPKRDRIYFFHREGKSPADNFFVYDVKGNAWSKPKPTGSAPIFASSYESVLGFDTANDRLVCVRLYQTKDEPALRRGVYVYDPEANAWADPLPLPAEVTKAIKNGNFGFYDPELAVFVLYFANDSDDKGTTWVYRYKKAGK